jgi:DNA-binding beta-propeller fold protein YncE
MKLYRCWSSLVLAVLGGGGAACGGGGGEARCDPDAPGTICTIAGSGERAFGGDGGPATEAALDIPRDTVVSPEGELWLLDFNNYRVRAIDARGVIRTVIGNGLVGDSPPEGVAETPALEASFNHTSDLFFHGGYLYLAAWRNSRIKRVRLADMMLENYAGRGRRTYYDGDGGPALAASLDLPASLTLDPAGNLVILDQGNQVLRSVDGSGTIRTIAGKCVANPEECGPGVAPAACSGSVMYAGSHKLACGDLETRCGYSCYPDYAGDGGPALELRMAQPFGAGVPPGGGIAYDRAGNLLFVDTDNQRIRKIDRAGIVTTIAGTGVRGYAGDGGPAIQAQLNWPGDIEIGPDDTIYFADTENSCVRRIDPDGIISTVAGQCSADNSARGFAGDGGPPLEAKLNRPHGIDLEGKKLYVTDSFNNRVRVVNLP